MTERSNIGDEKRAAQRHRTLKRGHIIFNHATSSIDCLVRNESSSGARLKVDSVLGIPDSFSLQIMDDPPRSCRVVWRKNQEIGVTFH